MHESRKARVMNTLAQKFQDFINPRRADGALRDIDQFVRTRGAITDPAIVNVELRAIAIPERRSADDLDFALKVDFSHAPKLLAQDFDLARELKFVRGMLIVAAA